MSVTGGLAPFRSSRPYLEPRDYPCAGRPAGHHRQPQRDRDATVRSGSAPAPREQLARRHPAGPLAQRVRLPRRPQVAQQRERVGVEQPKLFHIRDRQARNRRAAAVPRNRAVRQTARRAARRRRSVRPRPRSGRVAARPTCRAPDRLASSSPSGRNAWRNWISAPGRSLTQCSDRLATTRSKLPGANGRNSSSAATAIPPFSAAIAGARSQLTTSMPRARSSGATTPRPPTSSAWANRRVVSSSRSSRRSAASRSTSATLPTVRAARSRCRRTARGRIPPWPGP